MEEEREKCALVSLAQKSRKELVDWSKMEIDGGQQGSSQLDLSRARLVPTHFSYASIPDLFQRIFTLSFTTLGARGFSV